MGFGAVILGLLKMGLRHKARDIMKRKCDVCKKGKPFYHFLYTYTCPECLKEVERRMKSKTFKNSEEGSYVQVFKRPDEKALFDLAFFDGERTLKQARKLRNLLSAAILQAEEFDK